MNLREQAIQAFRIKEAERHEEELRQRTEKLKDNMETLRENMEHAFGKIPAISIVPEDPGSGYFICSIDDTVFACTFRRFDDFTTYLVVGNCDKCHTRILSAVELVLWTDVEAARKNNLEALGKAYSREPSHRCTEENNVEKKIQPFPAPKPWEHTVGERFLELVSEIVHDIQEGA